MKSVCATALGLLLVADLASAHHSYAMFQVDKTVSLTGTVRKWDWTNPHSWLVLVVPDSKGQEAEWQLEGSSPAIWRRYGGSREMIKPGDRVTVIVHPLLSGANGGLLQTLTIPDGRKIDLAAAAPQQ